MGRGGWAEWTLVVQEKEAQPQPESAGPTGSGEGPQGGKSQAWARGPWVAIQAVATSWPGVRRPGLPQLYQQTAGQSRRDFCLPLAMCTHLPGGCEGLPNCLLPTAVSLDPESRGVWPAQAPSQFGHSQGPENTKLAPYLPRGGAGLAREDSEKGCRGPHPQCQGGWRTGRLGDGLDTLFPGREPEASSDRESLQPPSSRLEKALRDPEAVFKLQNYQRAVLNADSRPSSTLWSQPLEGAGFWNRHFKHTMEAPSLSPMPGGPLFELQSLRLNAHEYG